MVNETALTRPRMGACARVSQWLARRVAALPTLRVAAGVWAAGVLATGSAFAAPPIQLSNQDSYYPRLVRLEANGTANGRLIATYDFAGITSPVYESTDQGATWAQVGTVAAPSPDDWHCCSTLYEMPAASGGTAKGTLLWATTSRSGAAGSYSFKIRLFRSTDLGRHWTLLSTPVTGKVGTWEPEFTIDAKGRLLMFYSSEEYQAQGYNQLLAHRVSTDGGVTWGPDVFDVAVPDGVKRPGMATVRKLPNGRYVMGYEICGLGCDTYIRSSSNGSKWGDPTSLGTRVVSTAGNHFAHAPTVSWADDGSKNGRLMVIGQVLVRNADNKTAEANGRVYFFNTRNGKGDWTEAATPLVTPSDGLGPCTNYSSQLQALPSADGKPSTMRLLQMSNVECRAHLAATPLNNPVNDGVYRLVAKHSGQVLDVAGCDTANNANVAQWPWLGGDCQRWNLTNQGNGEYTLVAQHSGMALDVTGCSTQAGGDVRQATPSDAACQRWKLDPVGDGWYRLIAKHSGLVLDVDGCSTTNGANVQQWTWMDNNCQRWKLERVSANHLANGSYRLTAKHSGQALQVTGCSASDGAFVQQWPWSGATCQIWQATATADGFYEFTPRVSTAQRLDVKDGVLLAGGAVRQWPSNGADPQRWSVESVGSGNFRLVNKRSGRVLDVDGCSQTQGTKVQQWDWLGGDCQRWQFTAVP